jgi:integrase/recombinase XerD
LNIARAGALIGVKAKILKPSELNTLLRVVSKKRYPLRNRVIILLSFKAGLRACEIAGLTWDMVLDGNGTIGHILEVAPQIAKKQSGRRIPLNKELRSALLKLYNDVDDHKNENSAKGAIIRSERGGHMRPAAIVNWFADIYAQVAFKGCSSHSGRRTFVTGAARKISKVGGSLRDVQQLAGHRSINTTERYIDGYGEAQRKIVNLI